MKPDAQQADFGYLRAAARLRLRLERWRGDQAFLKGGGRIAYATDSDVVTLFLDPQGNLGYAAVFEDEGDMAREVVAWVLARFIFYRLAGNAPLLLIPPHNIELEDHCSRHRQKSGNLLRYLQDEVRIIEELREAYRKTGDKDALIQGIEENAIRVVRLLYGGGVGPSAEARRMAELLRCGRLLHMERYIDEQDRWVVPVLYDDVDEDDRETLKELRDDWKARLKDSKSPATREYRVDRDAEALARLEWANAEAGAERRLILISGDHALQSAAEAYEVSAGVSFRDLYVRDPRAFLAAMVRDLLAAQDTEIPGPTRTIELGLIGWLDLLFTRFEPRVPGYLERLKKLVINLEAPEGQALARQFSRDDPNWAMQLRDEWTGLVNLAAVDAGMIANRELATQFAHQVAGMDADTLRECIEQHISDARNELWRSGMEAGFWSTAASEGEGNGASAEGGSCPSLSAQRLREGERVCRLSGKDVAARATRRPTAFIG